MTGSGSPSFDVAAVAAAHGFARTTRRTPSGAGVYLRPIDAEHAYWAALSFRARGLLDAAFGVIWPGVNAAAFAALRRAEPGGPRPQFSAQAGPPLYMCDRHLPREFRTDAELGAVLRTFVGGAPVPATLGGAVEHAMADGQALPSHELTLPAALAVLRRPRDLDALARQFLNAIPTPDVAAARRAYYAELAQVAASPAEPTPPRATLRAHVA